MKKLCLLAALATLAACQPQEKGYTIEGTLTGDSIPEGKVYLQKQLPFEVMRIDSAVMEHGKFRLQGQINQPEMYTLYIDTRTNPQESPRGKVFVTNFYLENSPITIEGEFDCLPSIYWTPDRKVIPPVIKGSATQDLYQQLLTTLKPYSDSLQAIDRQFLEEYTKPMMADREHKKDYTDIGINLVTKQADYQQQYIQKVKAFIQQNPSSVVALDQLKALFSGLTVNFNEKEIIEMKSWITDAWQGTPQLAELDSMVNVITPLALGNKYIDIDVENPDGKSVKLASLIPSGKYVLLDFWASWCGPCRAEIPHLVKVNKQYKDFAIISISVDEKREEWLKALKEENMSWTQARIADGIMGNTVKKYNITAVPTCIVLDPEGRFYKVNMRGPALDKFLKETYQH